MPLSKPAKGFAAGALLCAAAALIAWLAAGLPWNHKLQISSLTLAIVAGMLLGNAAPGSLLERLHPGLRFSQQKLLRLGIVLYGIRLTVADISRLGPRALALDITVIATVLSAGYWFGTRVFKLDADTALLVAAGSGICG
ncbi:MAG TPA: putative sulfate exporter family transporter, partial [Bryobacteraceae bacterium]|nr:putative sulfate exporter family transporter [Bryobacteraceae bacterium]